jgi:hypothetical protein
VVDHRAGVIVQLGLELLEAGAASLDLAVGGQGGDLALEVVLEVRQLGAGGVVGGVARGPALLLVQVDREGAQVGAAQLRIVLVEAEVQGAPAGDGLVPAEGQGALARVGIGLLLRGELVSGERVVLAVGDGVALPLGAGDGQHAGGDGDLRLVDDLVLAGSVLLEGQAGLEVALEGDRDAVAVR